MGVLNNQHEDLVDHGLFNVRAEIEQRENLIREQEEEQQRLLNPY